MWSHMRLLAVALACFVSAAFALKAEDEPLRIAVFRADATRATGGPAACVKARSIISFWGRETSVACLTCDATHPQSHDGKGGLTAEFAGLARAQNSHQIELSSLRLGTVAIWRVPDEWFVEHQLAAQWAPAVQTQCRKSGTS